MLAAILAILNAAAALEPAVVDLIERWTGAKRAGTPSDAETLLAQVTTDTEALDEKLKQVMHGSNG